MNTLILLFALLQTQPSAPSMIPRDGAPVFLNRVGSIDSLTIHYVQHDGQNEQRWDVVINDRGVLSRIEQMRMSDWHGVVLFAAEHGTTTRIDNEKFTGSLGVMKFAGLPFGFRIKVHNQPWALYVETGDAGRELANLIEAEAKKQKPAK